MVGRSFKTQAANAGRRVHRVPATDSRRDPAKGRGLQVAKEVLGDTLNDSAQRTRQACWVLVAAWTRATHGLSAVWPEDSTTSMWEEQAPDQPDGLLDRFGIENGGQKLTD